MEIALQVKDVRLVEDRVYEIAKVTGSKNKGVALGLLLLSRCGQRRSEKFQVGELDSGAFIMTANFREEFDASP